MTLWLFVWFSVSSCKRVKIKVWSLNEAFIGLVSVSVCVCKISKETHFHYTKLFRTNWFPFLLTRSWYSSSMCTIKRNLSGSASVWKLFFFFEPMFHSSVESRPGSSFNIFFFYAFRHMMDSGKSLKALWNSSLTSLCNLLPQQAVTGPTPRWRPPKTRPRRNRPKTAWRCCRAFTL